MAAQVIVLNGGSSSGKSGIARCLQAAAQADVVHRGVRYGLEVDTTHAESMACARAIAAHLD